MSREIETLDAYSMQAHGCELGIIRRVPKNCMYVTLSICGTAMDAMSHLKLVFLELADEAHPNHHWLKNPILHKRDLDSVGLNPHIHYDAEGCDPPYMDCRCDPPYMDYRCDPTYMDCRYDPLLFYSGKNSRLLLRPSGLIPLGKSLLLKDSPLPLHNFENSRVPFLQPHSELVERDIARYLYRDSIYPTANEVEKTYTFYQALQVNQLKKNVGSVTQSELFERYPGIHYNTVCRVPCRDVVPESIMLRREHSNKKDIELISQPEYTPTTDTHLKNAVDLYIQHAEPYPPIGQWNVRHMMRMESIFEGKDFQEDISEWDVRNVTWMHHIFKNSTFNRSLTSWNPEKLTVFGASNSSIPELFKLPPTLVWLDITNCPIHTLTFDKLNPKIKIYCRGTPLRKETVIRLIKFYTIESTLSEQDKSDLLEQFTTVGGKTRKRRKRTRRRKNMRTKYS